MHVIDTHSNVVYIHIRGNGSRVAATKDLVAAISKETRARKTSGKDCDPFWKHLRAFFFGVFEMSKRVMDRRGQKFGAWTVVEYRGQSRWLIRCQCGFERVTMLNNQMYGTSKSCGCLSRETVNATFTVTAEKQAAFIAREFNGSLVRQRSSDGYFDATAMCKIGDREFKRWRELPSTTEYFQALSAMVGKSDHELAQSNNQGTWIHPRAAMRLAQWISLEFAILVDGWVLDLVEGRSEAFGEPARVSPPVESSPVEKNRGISHMPSLEVAEHELKQLERQVKAMRCVVSGLRKAQKFLAFVD